VFLVLAGALILSGAFPWQRISHTNSPPLNSGTGIGADSNPDTYPHVSESKNPSADRTSLDYGDSKELTRSGSAEEPEKPPPGKPFKEEDIRLINRWELILKLCYFLVSAILLATLIYRYRRIWKVPLVAFILLIVSLMYAALMELR